MINKNCIRLFFLFFLSFLFAQFLFTMKFSEPYPAIIYPGFGGVYNNSEYNSYKTHEIIITFNNSKTIKIDDKLLFGEFQPIARGKIFKKFFEMDQQKDQKSYEEFKKFRSSLENRIKSKFSGDPRSIEIIYYDVKEYYRLNPIKVEKKIIDIKKLVF